MAEAKAGRRSAPVALDNLPADDELTTKLTEIEFLSRWWQAAIHKQDAALEMLRFVQPEALVDRYLRESYAFLTARYAAGESVTDSVVDRHLRHIADAYSAQSLHQHVGASLGFEPEEPEQLLSYGRKLVTLWRGRSQLELLEGASILTQDAISAGQSVKRLADDLMDRLVSLHSRHAEGYELATQEAIAGHLLSKLDSEKPAGIEWPWPLFQNQLGIIPPGTVWGITAYPGAGKSLLAANLFREWVLRDIPVIVWPGEMQLQFLERVVASMARVRKEYAEEGDWRRASRGDLRRYRDAMAQLVGLPWDIIQVPDLTPSEFLVRVKALRRKYAGRQVMVMGDHFHRFLYPPGIEADSPEGAGAATRQVKNFAQRDRDGGMSFVNFYQPKKADKEEKRYTPVLGATGIRGHGSVYSELDGHGSVFQRIVETDPYLKTPWGTPTALFEHANSQMPKRGKYKAPNTKPDDEHFYFTYDKHRIRGHTLETIMLNIHGPSGFIYEQDWLHGIDAEEPEQPTT